MSDLRQHLDRTLGCRAQAFSGRTEFKQTYEFLGWHDSPRVLVKETFKYVEKMQYCIV